MGKTYKTDLYKKIMQTASEIAIENEHKNLDVVHVEAAFMDNGCFGEVLSELGKELNENIGIDLDCFEEANKEIKERLKTQVVVGEYLKSEKRKNGTYNLINTTALLKLESEVEDFAKYCSEVGITKTNKIGACHMYLCLLNKFTPGAFAEMYENSEQKPLVRNLFSIFASVEFATEIAAIVEESKDGFCLYKKGEEGIEIEIDSDDEEEFAGLEEIFASGINGPSNKAKDYIQNLLEFAKTYDDKFIGREEIIETTFRTLSRKKKNNVIFVGEPGVGKTAVVYGMAKKVLDGDVPESLNGLSMYSIDIAGMLAGARFRGDFEERLKNALKEIKKDEKPLIFFDEIHTLMGAGACSDSSLDASNILKPLLTEGKVKVVGATTYEEYKKYVEKDKAFARRFQKVEIEEPSVEESIKIISQLKDSYESFHKVEYTEDSIESAVRLSKQYIFDKYLPDKAIDLIDEAGAYCSIHPEKGNIINEETIRFILSDVKHIPITTTQDDEMKNLKTMDSTIKSKVFGQDQAVDKVVEAIKLSKSGLGDDEKPVGSFLFVGPSGVGKTELAKQIADVLNIDFLRFDMSEYQESHSVAKLFGAPAGYVGYEDGGVLTEEVNRHPHSVVLFDEIEKAHPNIFKSFLQVMDYGMLTDSKGKKTDFRNCIIIMTSNAGATSTESTKAMGFAFDKEKSNKKAIEEKILKAVKDTFTPEFRNRLTATVIFNNITYDIGRKIVEKELSELNTKLSKKQISVVFTNACIDEITRMGVSDVFGAREIKRVIDSKIKPMFIEKIVNGEVNCKFKVDYKNNNFSVKKEKEKLKA